MRDDVEIAHVEDHKGHFGSKHTMTGFDTNEESLPRGYFTSSFFIGTMSVVLRTPKHAVMILTFCIGLLPLWVCWRVWQALDTQRQF